MTKNDLSHARELIKKCQEKQETYLDLGRCGITDLNDLPELFECTHLKTLILSNEWWNDKKRDWIQSRNKGPDNKLSSISIEMESLNKLTTLFLSGSRDNEFTISDIRSLEKLSRLQSLSLSSNQISDIRSLENLSRLHSLDLSGNEIFDFHCLEKLIELQSLILFGNKISNIRFLENLTGLHSLDLSGNEISDIHSLENLIGLHSLDLSGNEISDIRSLENLTGLHSLDLSGNEISDIRFLENLTGLHSLDLSSNQISDIRSLEKLSRLKSLNLHFNKISDIRFLENLTGLHSLDLGDNLISDIRSLEKLSRLKSLDLGYNEITDIRFLEKLIGLQSLDLGGNEISDFRFLEKLIELQSLDLGGNEISDIRFLEKLSGLQSLNLSSNQISDILSLEKLTELQSLDLGDNKIKKIPASIFQLNMAISLDQHSGGLNLYNNPVESPPLEILRQGRQSILDWFEAKKTKLNEIKIILIGDPKAGKTSLLRRLKYDTFDKDEPQTDGVNIEDINFGDCKTFKKQKSLHHLTGHFWDFGGQEIMNATHQFFLTHRSVYVLVLEARKDSDTSAHIRKWVKRIKTTGGDSPIIVVANKIDIHTGFGFENENELQQEFSQIKYFIKASCDTKKNIDFIKDKLEEIIPQAELFNTPIDKKWFQIKEKLQEETKANYFLDETKFVEICNLFKLYDKNKREHVITFLHDLGIVLHFEQLNLAEYYVLDPYWITYGVYQILTSSYAGKQNGIVNMDKLDYIVNEEDEEKKKVKYCPAEYKRIEYSAFQRRFLIDILHYFKLCFCLPDHSKFILPDLLATKEPTELTKPIKDSEDNIRFIYNYEYLPKSIMPHIMVEAHEICLKMWRTGCVLEKDGCTALVSYYRNRITITVTGEYKKKREFMAVIRHLINLTNAALKDKPRMLIPLSGTDDFVDYEEILAYERKGETVYKRYNPEKKIFDKYQISELLEGIPSQEEVTKKDLMKELKKANFGIEEIKNKLNQHYQMLIELPSNIKIKDQIQSAINEVNSKQTSEIVKEIMQGIDKALVQTKHELDEKLSEIYMDLKKTDDLQMKLKLAVPFINVLGINLETEFDLKSWAKKMYEKYEMKIFKLMGYV